MSEFDTFLTDLYVIPGKLLLLGDFNFHVDNPTKTDVNGFLQAISAASLVQHVTGPTHSHGHTLDLVFTRDFEFIIKKCSVRDMLMSDHSVVSLELTIAANQHERITRTSRNYRAIDRDRFTDSLQQSTQLFSQHGDAESGFEWYNGTLRGLLDSFAPVIVKTCAARPRMPWYSKEIHLARRRKRRAERKWRKSDSTIDRNNYLIAKRETSNLICRTKIFYFRKVLSTSDTKEVYKTLDHLLN